MTECCHNKFEFDKTFQTKFDALLTLYSNALNDLCDVVKGTGLKADYGVCNSTYKMRYITPKDISAYISNLIKGLESGLFHNRFSDIEMFTVASVKKNLEENECDPFETSSVLNPTKAYVNPKEHTLNDLLFMCENDVGTISVYSKGEMLNRIKLMMGDVKKMNDMHFAANMKKIVNAIPDIINKEDCLLCGNKAWLLTFQKYLQEFLIFSCTMNTITILQLIGYGSPAVEYTSKQKDSDSDEVVTECCMHKMNDFIIRNRIPFNCNMRDVVLQDMTPDFRDVHAALHFIMKDARSPISILVNKFATKESCEMDDSRLVSSMFLGHNHDTYEDDVFDKNTGSRIIGSKHPYDLVNFQTNVSWLDNIAFGNNHRDSNYRRDGVGNHHRHPIVNTLDMIYKIFSGNDLKSNEDIANNIVRVACLMRAIIQRERCGDGIDSYDITKDVLVLLGEIFTRNMLRLYYNNTTVIVYSDNMKDTGDPGIIHLESFFMEAEGQQPKPTQPTSGANTSNGTNNGQNTKPSVSFTNGNNQVIKGNIKTKTSMITQRLVQWLRNTFSKFFENFNKNHAKEIEYVKSKDTMNREIAKAIQSGQFTPNLKDYPDYKIPASSLNTQKIAETVKKYMDFTKTPNFDNDTFILECLPQDQILLTALKSTQDVTVRGKMWGNWVLYSSTKDPQLYTGKMSEKQWNELVTDLTETGNLLKTVTSKMSTELTSSVDTIKSELQKYEAATGNDPKIVKGKERMESLNNAVQQLIKIYETPALNSLVTKFYNSQYKMYRDIVIYYEQQRSNNSTDQGSTTNNQNQTNPNSQNSQGNSDVLNPDDANKTV